MPNARQMGDETPEQARIRYNAEMRDYRARRNKEGRPLKSSTYDYRAWKEKDVKRKYGITLDEAQAMLDNQGGECAICTTPITLGSGIGDGHIDHCHTTGKVRGMLCSECNLGLGKFKDSPAALRAAASYLERT